MSDWISDQPKRIADAISIAVKHGPTDGAHHKMWVIDQMLRALTGCPERPDGSYGESAEYHAALASHGVWDEGMAP